MNGGNKRSGVNEWDLRETILIWIWKPFIFFKNLKNTRPVLNLIFNHYFNIYHHHFISYLDCVTIARIFDSYKHQIADAKFLVLVDLRS